MSVTSALSAGRAAAERRMTSRVSIAHTTGGKTTNADGYEVDGLATSYTDVPFRLDDVRGHDVTIGGVTFSEATGIGHFPASQELQDGDVVRVDRGEWAGSYHRIVKAIKADQKTARKVPIVEVSQPEGWS